MSCSFSRLKRIGIFLLSLSLFFDFCLWQVAITPFEFFSVIGLHITKWQFHFILIFSLNFLWVVGIYVPWHAFRCQNLQDLVLFSHHVSSRNWTQVFRFGSKCLYPQSCHANPVLIFSHCLFAILRIQKSTPVPSSLCSDITISTVTSGGLVMALQVLDVGWSLQHNKQFLKIFFVFC